MSEFRTKDFRVAGFLVSRGCTLKDSVMDGVELQFVFDDSDGIANKASTVVVQYPNSHEQRYDAACRVMHDIVKSKTRKRG